MKRNEIVATVVWVAIGLVLVVIFNIYPQIKLGIVFAVIVVGLVAHGFWQLRKQNEREPGNPVRRKGAIANLVWLLIAALLIAIANIVPQLKGISGYALVAFAIGVIFWRFWQQRGQDPREKRLIFRRFSSKQLGTAAAVLMIINFFVIMFIAKLVENDSRQTIFIVLISSTLALSAPVGILFGAGIYNMLKRD
jgi:hypothetical protein